MKFLISILFSFCLSISFAQTSEETAPNDEVFTVVDSIPEFPGGTLEMVKYIKKETKYPKEARKKKWEGKTVVKFIVSDSGNIANVIVTKSSGYMILDDEAVRVISLMPKWKPGMLNNRNVSVYYNIPLNFSMQKKKKGYRIMEIKEVTKE